MLLTAFGRIPPDGVTLDEEKYPDNKGNYLAVTKLVVDWDAGTAGADPTFDQSSCGTAVSTSPPKMSLMTFRPMPIQVSNG